MMGVSKTKQRKRKARRNRQQEMLEARLARATGVTTATLKLQNPEYEGATGVEGRVDVDNKVFNRKAFSQDGT